MTTIHDLFQTLISSDEGTQIAVPVADAVDANTIRSNLVQRLGSYRKQLEAFLPTDQLPKSLKMQLNSDATVAAFSIGERWKPARRSVAFTILPPATPPSDHHD